MSPLPRSPAASLVMTRPPQSPGCGLHAVTTTDGHETASASETATDEPCAVGLSLRLVKMALRLGDVGGPVGTRAGAVTDSPLIVIGPPRDLTTSPAPTIRFFPRRGRPPARK